MILQVTMRYLHIVSTVLAVGGMAFLALCLMPALRLVEDSFRGSVLRMAQHRFERVVWFAIAGFTVSGVYNWILLTPTYRGIGPLAHALIGTKVLLAVVMFAIVFLRAVSYLQTSRLWLMVNLHLGAIVILLGAVLRFYRLAYLRSV